MPRAVAVLLATTIALAVLVASAAAESQTVSGKADIKKLVADNGRSAVTAKVFGLGGPCTAKTLIVSIFWGAKAYEVQAICDINGKWARGLYYNSGSVPGAVGTKKVSCRGFSLKYTAATKSWKAVVPRSCMSKAPSRIRVKAEGVNQSSAIPGEAGPTKLLRRG